MRKLHPITALSGRPQLYRHAHPRNSGGIEKVEGIDYNRRANSWIRLRKQLGLLTFHGSTEGMRARPQGSAETLGGCIQTRDGVHQREGGVTAA